MKKLMHAALLLLASASAVFACPAFEGNLDKGLRSAESEISSTTRAGSSGSSNGEGVLTGQVTAGKAGYTAQETFLDLATTPTRPRRVLENIRPLDDSRGKANVGVYLVEVDNGKQVAVKLLDAPLLENPTEVIDSVFKRDLSRSLQIQQQFADAAMAPRVHAVWVKNADELDQLKGMVTQQFGGKLAQEAREAGGAIVMDYVPDAWNFVRVNKPSNVVPAFFKQWTEEKLAATLRRIKQIESKMHELRVIDDDVQYFISRDGNIVLGDLDGFRDLGAAEVLPSLASDMQVLKETWERETQRRFSDVEYQRILRGL